MTPRHAPAAIEYPSGAGVPVVETDAQAIPACTPARFLPPPDVYVSGNPLLYYDTES